ncbi:MAG: hypothetical protein PF482_19840 [Desulfobacteraceae bacterium]|jgi:hypothetical protein|nr:hypothetical protein [Desulfobacteraceae bacterium]
MKKLKHHKLLAAFLIVVFLCTGLTCFITEDADKNSRIDLKDAVLHAQKNHYESQSMNVNGAMEACISTLGVVAGIKYLSTASSDAEAVFLNLCFLISLTDQNQFLAPSRMVPDASSFYSSFVPDPDTHPPIFS